ncbi:MAG TPA: phosphate ABC transporter ATP-binding protein PstB [Nitrososphaerales archaeon]|nr:phosphate ABC transporter ATP-binding protein PstB [Nitrososphaerales archaeon]
MAISDSKVRLENLSVYYGQRKFVQDVTLSFMNNRVTAVMGPSGCGKTTVLKTINRMIDLVPGARTEGSVYVDGDDVLSPAFDVTLLRRRVGMVFQKPNPFPSSIYDNVAFGPRIHGTKDKKILDQIVEESLKSAGLYNEVKDSLSKQASALSGGQQQRLCIARAIAVKPEVLLLDEPTSALDPSGSLKVEQLMTELKKDYTLVLVTHNLQQAARVADFTAFLFEGKLIEYGETGQVFENPKEELTERYITGKFG